MSSGVNARVHAFSICDLPVSHLSNISYVTVVGTSLSGSRHADAEEPGNSHHSPGTMDYQEL